LFLPLYYFGFPFRSPYFLGGWGYRSFEMRMWPALPFFRLFVFVFFGFVLVRLLSSTSRGPSHPSEEGRTFCPHCGGDLRQSGKAEERKGEKDVSLPTI
jgi:hypothetical protein